MIVQTANSYPPTVLRCTPVTLWRCFLLDRVCYPVRCVIQLLEIMQERKCVHNKEKQLTIAPAIEQAGTCIERQVNPCQCTAPWKKQRTV